MTEFFGKSCANLTAILWPNPRLDPVITQKVRKLQIFNLSGSILMTQAYTANQSIDATQLLFKAQKRFNAINTIKQQSKLQSIYLHLLQRITTKHLHHRLVLTLNHF